VGIKTHPRDSSVASLLQNDILGAFPVLFLLGGRGGFTLGAGLGFLDVLSAFVTHLVPPVVLV
jgi:hypothetical protein